MLARQQGNAIFQVIIVLSILIVSIYFVSDRVQTQRKVVLETTSVVKARFAIQSMVDYTYFAIQRRYCFTDTLLPNPKCELKTGVSGINGRSIERVLMSDEQAKNIVRLVNVDNLDIGLELTRPLANEHAVRVVKRLDIRTKAKDIPVSHPLFSMIDPLNRAMRLELKNVSRFKDLDLTIRTQITRDDGTNVPRTGNEVYFWVTVSLEDGTDKVLVVNNTKLEVTSYGTIYPRELGAFGLMIARDLRMDGVNSFENGDVNLPVFTGNPGGDGLVFMSPVFINRNIHLPGVAKSLGGQKASDKQYSPVTFADRVVIGNGRIYEKEAVYKPESSGGRGGMLWTDNKLFGGFKSGVLVDGALDKGMSVFGLVQTGTPVSDEFMLRCNARSEIFVNMEKIKSSEFYGNLKSATPLSWEYRLGLTEGNGFKPQGMPFGGIDFGAWGTGTAIRVPEEPSSDARGATLLAEVRLGNRRVGMVRLNKNTSVQLVAQVASPEYKAKLDADLVAAQAMPNATPVEIAARAAAINAANEKLAALALKVTNPGKIRLLTKPAVVGTGPQANLMDLVVTIENPESFLDDSMPEPHMVAPRIQLVAYDPIFHDHGPANTSLVSPIDFIQLKKTRFLNFTVDPAGPGTMQAPDGFSLSDKGAPISPSIPNDDTDWFDLDKKCEEARNAATGQSFGAASWNIDFAESSTFKSWNYADGTGNPPSGSLSGSNQVLLESVTFNENNSKMGTVTAPLIPIPPAIPGNPWRVTNRDEFKVYSIVRDCIIEDGADLVTGFFTCHTLRIQKRPDNKPLYIVGTFIVRKIIFVDQADDTVNSADAAKAVMKAGVHWMSIYHPDAPSILRNSAVLRSKMDPLASPCTDGASSTNLPIWASAAMKISRLSDLRACNVVSLRSKSNLMQWTAVDPDCGLLTATSTLTSCKSHPVNFFVLEHARGGGP